jgi:transcriptional regulator with XRE-family HTH domain
MRLPIASLPRPGSDAPSNLPISARRHPHRVDAVRFGRQFRALRIRKGLRQQDVANSARISRALISKIEHGAIESIRVRTLLQVSAAVEAILDVRLRWNGEQLDRLLDEAHAGLVETIVDLLRRNGWTIAIEVSFAVWGERGSIDVLAWHAPTGILLIIEVKSVVPDSQATLHGLDRMVRLAPGLAADRGWAVRSVARLLVVSATATSRRRVARLAATYDAAFPARGTELHRWLRRPVGSVSGLVFVSYATGGDVRRRRPGLERVRRPSAGRS